MIELIPITDVIKKRCKTGPFSNPGRQTKRRINPIDYHSNSKKYRVRCFKCGHREGQWIEVNIKGESIKHFLCNNCRQAL